MKRALALLLFFGLLRASYAPFSVPYPGAVDQSFNVSFSGVINYLVPGYGKVIGVAVGPEDEIYAGGHFTVVNGELWNGIARLNSDGSLNHEFRPPLFQEPSLNHIDAHQIFVQQNGTVWTGFGGYSQRFRKDGTPQPFSAAATSNPYVTLIYPDGSVLVDGNYTYPGYSWIQRFLPDGSKDPAFQIYTNAQMNAHLLLRDGKILVTRIFLQGTNDQGTAEFSVALDRHMTSGVLDQTFHPPQLRSAVCCIGPRIIERANGQLYLVGDLHLAGDPAPAFALRLNTDGSIDHSFTPDPALLGGFAEVDFLALQSNGKLLIAGRSSRTNGVLRAGLTRLTSNGSIDPMFDPGYGISDSNDGPGYPARIFSMALQRDGNILLAGDFTRFNGVPRDGLVRIFGDPIPDLTLRLVRANSTGALIFQSGRDADVLVLETASSLSSDPGAWTPVWTNVLGTASTGFPDLSSQNAQRFYRLRQIN